MATLLSESEVLSAVASGTTSQIGYSLIPQLHIHPVFPSRECSVPCHEDRGLMVYNQLDRIGVEPDPIEVELAGWGGGPDGVCLAGVKGRGGS